MNILQTIRGWLFYGGTRGLRTYEQVCVSEWKNKLSREAANVLDRQMRRFNLVQRSPGDMVVALYCANDKHHARWTDEELFANRAPELTASRLWFSAESDDQQIEIKGDIVLHEGRLSSIEFSQPPRCLRRGFTVLKIKTFFDPMEQLESPSKTIDLADFGDGLGPFLRKLNATDLREPLSTAEKNRRLESIDASLPGRSQF